jgi:flagellar biosynthetic protein FlhB
MTNPAERIHPASPRRRQQAREQGQVAKSRDLAQAVVLLCGVAGLIYGGSGIARFFGQFARNQWSGPSWQTANAEQVVSQWNQTIASLAQSLLPLLLLLLAVGVVVHLGQTGFLIRPDRLVPQWSRLNPATGIQRLFSADPFVGLAFGLLKVAAVLVVVGWSCWSQRERWLGLAAQETPALAAGFLELVLWMTVKAAGALLVLGVIDYAWQRWRFEQKLRMTPEELREELRQQEGDPQQIRHRRERQRILALGRVGASADVPERDAA